MANPGKQFEDDFKASVPEGVYYYRLRDGTAGWDSGGKTRFQSENDFDCVMYSYPIMYALELKSYKGTSLPYKNLKNNQLKGLAKADMMGIRSGLIINPRDLERCFFVPIRRITGFMASMDRKSFPNEWIIDNGIEIDALILRKRYRYNIEKFIVDTR